MKFHSLPPTTCAIIVSIISLYTSFLTKANYGSFTVDLIHRDSPKSPHFDPSLTPWERMSNAIKRSNNRVNLFMSNLVSPRTASIDIISSAGDYFINMSIGMPPVQFLGIADTGGELTWIQCKPCKNCYEQKPPLFDPKSSLTYRNVLCDSKLCKSVKNSFCSDESKICHYSIGYADRSYTDGVVATETVKLASTKGQPLTLPRIIFGCGHDNGGFSNVGSGLVGLGGGNVSFISQISSLINGKFSYCLAPHSSSTNSSKLNFGSKAVVLGNGVVSTPLVIKSPFYRLTLKGLSVGGKRLEFSNSSSITNDFQSLKGNIAIDSGATLTYLPSALYLPLELQMKRAMTSLKRVNEPRKRLKLCYRVKKLIDAPIVTVHFTGADVKLNPMNTFIRVAKNIQCLAFLPHDIMPTFGNLAQTNFLVGYDLKKKAVSFKPTDCTKQ